MSKTYDYVVIVFDICLVFSYEEEINPGSKDRRIVSYQGSWYVLMV